MYPLRKRWDDVDAGGSHRRSLVPRPEIRVVDLDAGCHAPVAHPADHHEVAPVQQGAADEAAVSGQVCRHSREQSERTPREHDSLSHRPRDSCVFAPCSRRTRAAPWPGRSCPVEIEASRRGWQQLLASSVDRPAGAPASGSIARGCRPAWRPQCAPARARARRRAHRVASFLSRRVCR